jgi:hypothetical protein
VVGDNSINCIALIHVTAVETGNDIIGRVKFHDWSKLASIQASPDNLTIRSFSYSPILPINNILDYNAVWLPLGGITTCVRFPNAS